MTARPLRLALAAVLFGLAFLPTSHRENHPDRWELVLATGGTSGVYYRYGDQLAGLLSGDFSGSVVIRQTSGSGENLDLLQRNEVGCAFVAGDAAAAVDPATLAGVARLYDDYLHLVVRPGAGIDDLTDLPSRRVSVGPPRSGTFLMVERLFSVADIDLADIDAHRLGIDESLRALAAGGIDAFFWSGGVPTGGVDELAAAHEIRLVPLDRFVPALRAGYDGGYRSAVIPIGRYGLSANVGTLAVPNVMICRTDVPQEVIAALLDALVSGSGEMGRVVPQAATFDLRAAINVEPLPMHPAAREWYRATKP